MYQSYPQDMITNTLVSDRSISVSSSGECKQVNGLYVLCGHLLGKG